MVPDRCPAPQDPFTAKAVSTSHVVAFFVSSMRGQKHTDSPLSMAPVALDEHYILVNGEHRGRVIARQVGS
jgi:hypothetical protein